MAETEPTQWRDQVDDVDAVAAAHRAGRPGSRAGVPNRRNPAMNAGGTILLRWSFARGAVIESTDPMLSRRPCLSGVAPVALGGLLCRPSQQPASKYAETSRGRYTPARGTPLASTRGKGR